jgi:hypothetical protein
LNESQKSFTCYLDETYSNDLLVIDERSFDYEQNNFVFKLRTNAISNSKYIRYEYQLIGFDAYKKDTKPGENSVSYSNLLAGNYVLKVKAINIDGSTSNEVSYTFEITPPYWNTWWFITLIVFLALIMITSFFFFRVHLIKRKLILENRVKASEIRTIKAQMNPHFIFNSLNSIQDLILSHDIRKSNYYLSVFADLMRSVLTVSGEDEISLEREIEILSTYVSLEKLRFEDDLEVTINCELSQSDKEEFKLPSLLIQPYVENAFKHGLLHKKGMKKLEVNFLRVEDYLICEIIDNGIGISKSKVIRERQNKAYKSFSVSANQKRIDLINDLNPKNRKIELLVSNSSETEFDPGTKLVLRFPL